MKKPVIHIKKILLTIMWCVIAGAGIVLLQAGMHSQSVKKCKEVDVDITGVNNNFFIDETDVKNIIRDYVGGKPEGKTLESFNLRDIENRLEKDTWIKNAELYFDNNDVLRVHVDEREPAARLFATDGSTFYIDTSIMILPLSDKFSARLPVFTGFPKGNSRLSAADSSLLRSVLVISEQLQKDSFLMAMIDQVDITPQRTFEMVPKIGNQTIVFGDANDAAEKFTKLKMFYSKVITVAGWSRYSSINLQYKNQVVAKMKDAADKTADSLRTLQIMQLIADRAAKEAEDSTIRFAQENENNTSDGTMIEQSIERDEPDDAGSIEGNAGGEHAAMDSTAKPAPVAKPAAKPAGTTKPAAKPAGKPTVKPAASKPKPAAAKPRAVMGQRN
ncbi:MAG: FtsQ-type POTRA domain-containing protein [Ferruginibacter sp.]